MLVSPTLDWIKANPALTAWLGAASVVMLVGSLIVTAVLIIRMSEDYFLPDRDPHHAFAEIHPVLRWSGLILKNLVGISLFITGTVMVFLPGQGLLVMFMGIMLMNFPGKQRLELNIVRRRPVYRTINWLRAKAGRPPLKLPEA
jgi:hypothetical protein